MAAFADPVYFTAFLTLVLVSCCFGTMVGNQKQRAVTGAEDKSTTKLTVQVIALSTQLNGVERELSDKTQLNEKLAQEVACKAAKIKDLESCFQLLGFDVSVINGSVDHFFRNSALQQIVCNVSEERMAALGFHESTAGSIRCTAEKLLPSRD